ncbi:MAG: putative Sulfate-transporting ATPase [Promethearchaeota archaeon]|nr:MAG: putative Sulfate-transporting ATPase [Candidatus Lokiarchaeota archaeon]
MEELLDIVQAEKIHEEAYFTDLQFEDLMDWLKERRFYKIKIKIDAYDTINDLPIILKGKVLKTEDYKYYERTLLILIQEIIVNQTSSKFSYLLKIKKSTYDLMRTKLIYWNLEPVLNILTIFKRFLPSLRTKITNNLKITEYKLINEFTADKGKDVVFLKKDLQEAFDYINKNSRDYKIKTITDGYLKYNNQNRPMILEGFVNYNDEEDKIEFIIKSVRFKIKKSKENTIIVQKTSTYHKYRKQKLLLSKELLDETFVPEILYFISGKKKERTQNVITIENLTISFDNQPVIKDVNFSIKEGEIVGIIGESGAGKTITIKAILGQIEYEGSVKVLDINANKTNKIAPFIGYVPQEIALMYSDFTPMENIIHFGRQYGLDEEFISRKAKNILKDLQISEVRNIPLENLSGGQKKRVSVAISMIHDPKILILDEPTSGLDPMMRFELWKIFDRINRKYGITLIVISHYLDEIEYCDKAAIYLKGIGMYDFDTPISLKTSLPGEGKSLEFTLEKIDLDAVKIIENMEEVKEVIQRGKRIRILSDRKQNDLKSKITQNLKDAGIKIAEIHENVVVDMVDYFTVKTRKIDSLLYIKKEKNCKIK